MATAMIPTTLQSAQTGNADSTNVAMTYVPDRLTAVRIISTVGATPTVTVNIKGSMDGVNFTNVSYSVETTPATIVSTPITITTATSVTYFIQGSVSAPWVYLKLVMSANTNVTLTTFVL